MVRRQWMFDTLRRVFESHGFLPIQTPSFENLSTLTGKYGEEGDQLIFKILNNGDYLAKADDALLASKDSKALTPRISKKALRYDLTVPFARFVVMNRNELSFPFKRYQIQNVWRGDRPGKGRYQEFTQCDCDIIGTDSTLCELELVQIFSEGLTALGVPGFRIIINDRRVLAALAAAGGWGLSNSPIGRWLSTNSTRLGRKAWSGNLNNAEFRPRRLRRLPSLVALRNHLDPLEALDAMSAMLQNHEAGQEALVSLRELVERAMATGVSKDYLRIDALLARGLDYYTGAIFEVTVDEAPVGSICGGGRYDDLTGIFGWSGMSGVGVSFGADRIEDVLNHFDAWPAMVSDSLDVMVVQMDGGDLAQELAATASLRDAGVVVRALSGPCQIEKAVQVRQRPKRTLGDGVGRRRTQRWQSDVERHARGRAGRFDDGRGRDRVQASRLS